MAGKDAFKIPCLSCKAKNRIPPQKEGLPAKRGRCDIMSVPNTLVFDNGRLVENLVGQIGKHNLMMKMTRYL
ncbi:MAG: hypothetical protein JRI76_11160 [Deltaproteobacteria bacterium]|nr:hypothetical protein [Deltaproteobacteria bacterium]MBW1955205.1 hypothetical protein [Deltaproteobacteria bacterium]MBW2042570.1 hypothetical protein [Deltaproteobacteria bacterium]MBW2130924.1 hypothetical protein [Deltaproteobacteria bacterium]